MGSGIYCCNIKLVWNVMWIFICSISFRGHSRLCNGEIAQCLPPWRERKSGKLLSAVIIIYNSSDVALPFKVHLTSIYLQPSKNYFVPNHVGEKKNNSYMLFPQFSMNFQKFWKYAPLWSTAEFAGYEFECSLLHQLWKRFSHRERLSESKQRRKTSSRICPMSVAANLHFLLILSDFCAWTSSLGDFKARNFR